MLYGHGVGHTVTTVGHVVATTGHTVLTAGHSVTTVGHEVATTGHAVFTTGHSVATGGHEVLTTGHTVSVTGHSVTTVGHEVATTGHVVSVTGHSVADVVGTLAPLADRFYATAPDDPRAAPASAVAEVARVHCPEVAQVEPVQEAVRQALEAASKDDLVCVTGSFYTISEVPRPPSRRTVEDVNFSVTSAV